VFGPGDNFQPSLIYEGKASSLLYGGVPESWPFSYLLILSLRTNALPHLAFSTVTKQKVDDIGLSCQFFQTFFATDAPSE
jgi:hypothetical protein